MQSGIILEQGHSSFRVLQLELGTLPEPIALVVSQLLELLSSHQSTHHLHWRYELMASAILIFLLPPVDDSNAKVGSEKTLCHSSPSFHC